MQAIPGRFKQHALTVQLFRRSRLYLKYIQRSIERNVTGNRDAEHACYIHDCCNNQQHKIRRPCPVAGDPTAQRQQ